MFSASTWVGNRQQKRPGLNFQVVFSCPDPCVVNRPYFRKGTWEPSSSLRCDSLTSHSPPGTPNGPHTRDAPGCCDKAHPRSSWEHGEHGGCCCGHYAPLTSNGWDLSPEWPVTCPRSPNWPNLGLRALALPHPSTLRTHVCAS